MLRIIILELNCATMSENVRVIVRSRPMNKNEKDQKVATALELLFPVFNREFLFSENCPNREFMRETGKWIGSDGASEEFHLRQCFR